MRPRRAHALLLASAAIILAACAAPNRAGAATTQPAPPAEDTAARTDDVALPEYSGYVTDRAGVLDESARAKLEAFLDQLARKTGVQFAVLTVPSTAPLTPAEYKVRVFEKWGIGRRDEDDGLLMLVAIAERRVEFETGYGLEGTLPDGLQSRVVRRDIAPEFRSGNYAAGITAGVLRCAERIGAEKGVRLEWDGRELRYSERRARPGLLTALVLFVVIALLVTAFAQGGGPSGPFGGRRRRHGWDAGWGGGWGGGFGGWGGGLGGGGGGGSFGGFGGGGSGGGGGGGSW